MKMLTTPICLIALAAVSSGSETPKPDIELIRKRLDDARRLAEGA